MSVSTRPNNNSSSRCTHVNLDAVRFLEPSWRTTTRAPQLEEYYVPTRVSVRNRLPDQNRPQQHPHVASAGQTDTYIAGYVCALQRVMHSCAPADFSMIAKPSKS